MDKAFWIGLGLGVLGIGIRIVITVVDMTPTMKKGVGIFGGLLILFGGFVMVYFSGVKFRSPIILISEETSQGVMNLTPSEFAEPYLHGKHFRLTDLIRYGSSHIIEDRTFEDCWIYGPAVVYPQGIVVIQNNAFQGIPSLDYAFWEISKGQHISGVIALKNCTFRRCTFVNVSFIGTRESLEQWFKENP